VKQNRKASLKKREQPPVSSIWELKPKETKIMAILNITQAATDKLPHTLEISARAILKKPIVDNNSCPTLW
jgi:hypothetical protein